MTTPVTAAEASDGPGPAAAQSGPRGASVEFSDLRKAFGRTVALDGLDLTIRPGELLALLGPSGCGKTTALRVLAGFERPDSGDVLMDGEDITSVPAHRRDAGMVFQSYSLFPHLSAADNVAFGLRMRRVAAAERRRQAGELLDLVGLSQHADRYPHQLSGGQQQRVALARALALRPKVLLLDEPLSALDAQVRTTLRAQIRALQQELAITTLFVTHDQEEALSTADRVAVMRSGRLEQCAAPAELYEEPATAFVAEFVGTMNRLPGVLDSGDVVHVLGRRLPVRGPQPSGAADVEVLVRPEAVDVSADEQGTARVITASFRGSVTRLSLALPDGTQVQADVASHRAPSLPVGSAVTVSLPDRSVLVDRGAGGDR